MTRPIFFLHIPKAAGTSLRLALEKRHQPHEILPDEHMIRRQGGSYPREIIVANSIRLQGSAVRLVRGHYHFSLSEFMINPLIVTVLRDPVARSISNIRHHARADSLAPYLNALSQGRLPIPDNMMTRFLGGTVDLISNTRNHRDFLDDVIPDPTALLDSALQRLERVDCLGIVEQMDLFQARLEACDIRIAIGRYNVAPQDELQLDSLQLETIERHNQLDSRLYAAAKDLVMRTATSGEQSAV